MTVEQLIAELKKHDKRRFIIGDVFSCIVCVRQHNGNVVLHTSDVV